MPRHTAVRAFVCLCLLALIGCGDSGDDEPTAVTTASETSTTDDAPSEESDDSEQPEDEAPISLTDLAPCDLFTAEDAAVAMAVPAAAIPTGPPEAVAFFVGPDRCGYQPADAVEVEGSPAAVMVFGGRELAEQLRAEASSTPGMSPHRAAGFDGYLIGGDDSGSIASLFVDDDHVVTFILDRQGEDGSAAQLAAVAALAETVLARI